MGGRRAKLNVKTKEEPKEDEDEEEAEDEAFVTFSFAPFSFFLVPFFFLSFSVHFQLSLPVLSCSFEKLQKIKRLFLCFFLFDVRLMHTVSVKFTHYFLTMLSLSFGESVGREQSH